MKNTVTAPHILGESICGKRVVRVEVHNSHGEVLELTFEDGNRLHVCSTHGLEDETVRDDPNDIYVSLNGKSL
jgi:hypothetical protein